MDMAGVHRAADGGRGCRPALRHWMVEARHDLDGHQRRRSARGGTGGASDALVHAYGGYTANLAIDDLVGGRAWVAFAYDGKPLTPEHGGPARLIVPHLYLWKSVKWISSLELLSTVQRGFWENLGYHDRGDPWQEQRYPSH